MIDVLTRHFGILVAVLSIAAMVVSMVYDVGCLVAEKLHRTTNLQKLRHETDALAVALQVVRDAEIETAKVKGRLADLVIQRNRLEREDLSVRLSRFVFIHEIGESHPGTSLYATELAVDPIFITLPESEVMFARRIWRYRNFAHIWAESDVAARDLFGKVVARKSAIHVTKINPVT